MTALPPEITITAASLPMAMLMGLVFGMGPCLISCLPYLGPVFLATDGGVRQSWRILAPLSAGRLCVYGGFGAAAGLLGGVAEDAVGVPVVRAVVGLAGVLVGLSLLLGGWSHHRACAAGSRGTRPVGLFLMGIGMALTPCAPLGVVLVSAAGAASPLWGASLGLAFGLGAVTVPSLVYGIGMAHLGSGLRQRLGEWRKPLEWLSAVLLIAAGVFNLAR
ncbi:MAG: sulfite exporter TauE/SafE family protein [Bacteroidales bacterium]